MVVDKNGRLFGKINIIDIAVILVVIAVIAGVFVRFTGGAGKIVTATRKIEFTVEIDGIRDFTVSALERKGVVTDKRYSVVTGEITDVQTTDAEYDSTRSDGKIVRAPMEDRYTSVVTIVTDGKESDSGYFDTNNEEIAVGREYTIYSKYVCTTGVIRTVSVQ
jgi:hypothetical protein